jgi:hypothetical protein
MNERQVRVFAQELLSVVVEPLKRPKFNPFLFGSTRPIGGAAIALLQLSTGVPPSACLSVRSSSRRGGGEFGRHMLPQRRKLHQVDPTVPAW